MALATRLQKASRFGGEEGKPAFPGSPLYARDPSLLCFLPSLIPAAPTRRRHSLAVLQGFPEVVGAEKALATHGFN